jgi:hypothetical protein
MKELEELIKLKQSIEESILKERQRLMQIATSVGWTAGINRSEQSPRFQKEKRLLEEKARIEERINGLCQS